MSPPTRDPPNETVADGHGRGLVRTLNRIRDRFERPVSPRVKRLLMYVAAAVFLGGGLLALRSLDVRVSQIRWLPLVLAAVVAVPVTAVVNAAEYAVLVRVTGQRAGLWSAVRTG